MKSKQAEIISRVANFRDRGISKEAIISTLIAQYTWTSLKATAEVLGVDSDSPAQAVTDSVFERKARRAVSANS